MDLPGFWVLLLGTLGRIVSHFLGDMLRLQPHARPPIVSTSHIRYPIYSGTPQSYFQSLAFAWLGLLICALDIHKAHNPILFFLAFCSEGVLWGC